MTVTTETQARARDLIAKALVKGGLSADAAAGMAADAVQAGAGLLDSGVKAGWLERLHPRDKGGQFTDSPGGGGADPNAWRTEWDPSGGKWIGALGDLADKLEADHPGHGLGLDVRNARDSVQAGNADMARQHLETAQAKLRDHSFYTGGRGDPTYLHAAGNSQLLGDHLKHLKAVKLNPKPSPGQLTDFARGFAGAAAEPAAGLPSLVTIPDVELLAAGTWELSTGRQTFTRDDLTHAVEATGCPSVGAPVIKIGHVDGRFTPQPRGQDGEPAIGRVANLRTDASGMKLLGDLAGMPGWLASITASAYPRRSIEGSYGFRCQTGHVHPFVITAVALLGVTPPGVGVLSGLPDIASLYGLTASAEEEPARPWRTQPLQAQEGRPMPVTEEDVRRAYYESPGLPPSWWITELQMYPAQLIVSDGDGQMYRVPFRIAGAAVEFESAAPLASYDDLAASRGTGPVIVYGSAEMSRTFTVTAADSNAGWELRDGKWVYDPDGDGDDDSSAEGDTDHSHWDANGKQLKHIPPNPKTGKGGSFAAASVDNSPWDAAKAYANGSSADDPEAFFRAICAAEKTGGDPATQDHWALPYKYTPDSPPNAAAVRAALAALGGARGGVKGLKSPDAAKARLEKIMASISPGYSAASGEPAASVQVDASGSHGVATGRHSHRHSPYGSQGGDGTHEHEHAHNGDNIHDHHGTQAGAGTTEGGVDVDLTDTQITSLKLSLGLGDDTELDGTALVSGVGALREAADKKVAASAVLPSTVVAVEKSVWEATQRQVEASQRYRERKEREERDDVIASAVKDGKFGPTRAEDWRRVWDNDPEGTRRILASLPKNAVPVEDIGSPGSEDSEMLDEEYARLFPTDAPPQAG